MYNVLGVGKKGKCTCGVVAGRLVALPELTDGGTFLTFAHMRRVRSRTLAILPPGATRGQFDIRLAADVVVDVSANWPLFEMPNPCCKCHTSDARPCLRTSNRSPLIRPRIVHVVKRAVFAALSAA